MSTTTSLEASTDRMEEAYVVEDDKPGQLLVLTGPASDLAVIRRAFQDVQGGPYG
jgi:hypothetical protein